MHHALFEVARAHQREGQKAAVSSTARKFEFELDRASIEVETLDDGLMFEFGGDLWGVVPIMQRIQHVPVPALPFDQAIRMGRELVTRVGAVLEAARRHHAAT